MSKLTTAVPASVKSSLAGNLIDVNSARYLKLAVAVAVIRCRPAGLSGQEYAQRLCADFQQSNLTWKCRADTLQEELLQLQQAIVRSELVISTLVGGDDAERNEDDVYNSTLDSCPLPSSSGGRLKRCAVTDWRRVVHRRISSDTTDNNQVVPGDDYSTSDALLVDQSDHAIDSNFASITHLASTLPNIDVGQYSVNETTILDTTALPSSTKLSDRRSILDRHVLFLRTVLGFGSRQAGRTQTVVSRGDVDQLTVCTMKWVLDNVVQGLCDLSLGGRAEPNPSTSLMTEGLATQAIATIGTLADRLCLHRGEEEMERGGKGGEEIIDLVITAAGRLVSAIIDNRFLENTDVQKRLIDCLLIWSEAASLRNHILLLLLQTVSDCGTALRIDRHSLAPYLMENIFHVFRCVEEILEREASRSSEARGFGEELCGEASKLLSDAVLHLSSSAPLFCHYAWKIMALVDIVQACNQ